MPHRRKIQTWLQQHIRERAQNLCEYCHASEEWQYVRFTVDHIIPLSMGGTDRPDNYRGHRDEGVFLLLIEDDDGKFRWEIWKSRKQQEDVKKFNKETFEGMLDEWLEKWAGI